MLAPQHEGSLTDLSGSRWRDERARTATPNPLAPHGLKPSSGQLSGPGGDCLHLAIRQTRFPVRTGVPGRVALGERGPLLAPLDWAQRRGVNTFAAGEVLSSGDLPRPVPLRAFQQVIVDIQHTGAISGATAWGLFPSDRADEPVRILLPTTPAATLLATPTAAVGINSNGLHLLKRHITVTGWSRTERGLLLTTPDGQLRLGLASLGAQLLARLGRAAPQIELRPVPISGFLAPILTRLTDLATAHQWPGDVYVTIR